MSSSGAHVPSTGAPRWSARPWSVLILGGLTAVVVLAAWLRTPAPLLREQLKNAQFWSLEIGLLLVLSLGALVLRELCRTLHRGDALRMAGLAALGVGLVLLVAPRTNRIYYDEHIYQSIGQNLSDLKRAQMCNDGTVEYGRLQCWNGEYNKQPYAYPHLLSVVYRVVGVSDTRAFAVNAVSMALTVCGVYLLVLTLFGDRAAGVFAGLLVALTPQQILWSATAAVEPTASLACVVALLCAAGFVQSRSTVALAATGVASAYAVQFRPESFLILPVIGLLLWRTRDELRRPRFYAVALLAFVLVAVHIAHMFAVRNEGWGTADARLSLAYVLANLEVNGSFYLGDERFPVIVTLLALGGLATRSSVAGRGALALYFLLFWGIYLFFYAGSYNYGADVRYSLMTYPPITALGGLGASRLLRWVERFVPGGRARWVVAAGLVFQFLLYLPVVRATTEEAWAARADVRFARSLAAGLAGNTYVLTQNPGMFHLWGINAGQTSLVVTNPGQLNYLDIRYAGGVYLHWNFWCNVQDLVQQDMCRRALATGPAEAMLEHRERDQRFALYRFRGRPRSD